MKEYAKRFYTSRAWANCRKAYRKSVGGLCEVCLRHGRYTPGDIVHHKIHITPQNITDPNITMDWGNLELVCKECHAQIHASEYIRGKKRRYTVSEDGRVSPQVG